jgi:hypothetical protein
MKGLTKQCIGIGIAAVMTLGMLTGCGSEAVDTDASVEESTSEVNEESSETTEQTETVVEEEAPVTYAEENGWNFSDLSPMRIMCYTFWQDEDKNEVEGPADTTIEQQEALYSFSDITKSEPDENGNVVYTIGYTVMFKIVVNQPSGDGWTNPKINTRVSLFSLVDEYTGTEFPSMDIVGDDSYDIYTDIVWDDATYSVGYTGTTEWEYGTFSYSALKWTANRHVRHTLSVTAPEDYDGLVLCINNKGTTNVDKKLNTEEATDAEIITLDDGETWDDYTFIRVSDYVKE